MKKIINKKMNILTTKDLKIKFLGITPVLKEEMGFFNPQEIISFSALLTFKGKSVRDLLKETLAKGEKVEDRIKIILRKSSLRGHASLSTTPVISFLYEGSKFLDSMLTGFYFGSFLVSSGRRTDTTRDDIVFPISFLNSEKLKEKYKSISEKIINFYNQILEKGIKKDVASKILQYGIYGTGIIQLPLESIISFKRECEIEKDWMPEEGEYLIKIIEKELKKMGVDLLYSTRLIAPRNTYPYPNIFKNPQKSNLARELVKENKDFKDSKIISYNLKITNDLKERLKELKEELEDMIKDKEKIKKEWQKIILKRQQILRDYNLAARIDFLSSVPWRVWGEKKRHRTCPQIIESIYYCANRALVTFEKFEKEIEKDNLSDKIIEEIEKIFSIPLAIKKEKDLLGGYLKTGLLALKGYKELINLGAESKEAIFIVPRAVKIDILQSYDLYNLLTGYYPLRLCDTAEEEMKRNTVKEVVQIKNLLSKEGHEWLNDFIRSKCEIIGFCPEEKSCGFIKNFVKEYDDNFHKEMKEELENKFQKILKEIL